MKCEVVLISILIVLLPGISVSGNITDFEGGAKEAIANLYPASYEAMVNITVPADHYVSNATFIVTGLPAEYNSSAYPEAVTMKLENTTLWSFLKTGFGPVGRQDRFSTDAKQAKLDFSKGGGSSNVTIRLPKNAYIERAVMQLNGSKPASTSELVGLSGTNAGDMFGFSASCAGDVNNDGYDDVIVGAPSNSAGGTGAGRAYLYFGGPSMDKNPDVTFTGAALDDRFGISVSTAGDVNNDGYDDVIIGAHYNDAGGNNAGRAYIFFGSQNMDNVADVIFTGAAAGDLLGVSTSDAGDVNNDGYDDVIVGATGNDSAGNNAGAVYLYFGGQNMDNIADAMFTGETINGSFGQVSRAGDVNNDGYDDILVGAWEYGGTGARTGRAYIYLGSKNPDNVPDVIFSGEGDGDYFGFRGLSGGDINNNSYSDVIIGAHNNDGGGNRAGRVYLYNGSQNMDNITDVTFTGFVADDLFGSDAAFAGDVNNDGYGDIIISATGNDSLSTNSGVAYIFFGGQSIDTIPDRTYIGPAQHWWFGYTVNGAGDVNNDGYDDFLIAWDNFQNTSTDPGYVNIYSLNDPVQGILDINLSIGSRIIWNKTGLFNGTAILEDFSQQLNDYLRSAPASGSDGYGNLFVDVPVTVRVKSEGNITLTDMAIQYQYNATVSNFAPTINGYISAHKNEKDVNGTLKIPLKVSSLSAGRTKIFSLNITRDMPPILFQQIKTIEMIEDTVNSQLIDLYQYFKDDVDGYSSLNFSVVSSTNSSMVKLWISGKRYLSADVETGGANDNWTGTVEAVVACTDHWGQKTESNRFTIVVRNVNDAPVITSTPVLKAEAEVPYFYNVTAIDGDNDILHFNLTKAPPGMTIDSLTGKIQWMPMDKGYFEVNIVVSDGNMTAFQNYFLLLGNIAPMITSMPPLTARTGELYVYNITAEDPNNDDLIFSLNNQISGMEINATSGQITWVPAIGGSFDVSVRVSDGKLKVEQNFTINVTQLNRAPKFVSKAVTATVAGMPYQYLSKASDDDGDTLEFYLVSGPQGMTVGSANGMVSWTPVSVGNFSVVLKVEDGKGAEALQEFTITVAEKVKVKVEITRPSENGKVKGKIMMAGTAIKGTLEVVSVQVKVDDGPWTNATGTDSWQFSLDTSKLNNGAHSLAARAFDGTDYSDPVTRTFSVDNKNPNTTKGFIPGFEGLVVVAVIGLALVMGQCRRKK
jgi:hypothetical protein